MPERVGTRKVSPSTDLVEMAMAYFPSRVVCAAARLGIADVLADSEQSTAQIAAACKANKPSMYRLLRTMAALGLLEETSPEQFRLTKIGQPGADQRSR